MTSLNSIDLEDLQEFFERQRFECAVEAVGQFPRVLIATDPYTVLLLVETDSTEQIEEVASRAQAELTGWAADREDQANPRDLYVLVHVRTGSTSSVDTATIERVSSDTSGARKFVRINLTSNELALTRALRPFLPIQQAGAVDYGDPLQRLAQTMIGLGTPKSDVDSAFASFHESGEVTIS